MLLYCSRADLGPIGQGLPRAEIPEDLASDVAFEAADNFGFGFTFGSAPADVRQCRLVSAHADDDHPGFCQNSRQDDGLPGVAAAVKWKTMGWVAE